MTPLSPAHAQAIQTVDERLRESERFHMGAGRVNDTLRTLAADLEAAGIDYAIVDGMALNAHGFPRETVDVDVLVRPDGLAAFHAEFVGRGYLPAFDGARKTFRNTRTNTKVEFITSGEFPGDGKPKPVVFPDPAGVAVTIAGVRIVALQTLIELKLASGMTQPARRRDLADVQDLIRTLSLSKQTAAQLDPFVRETFLTLWQELQATDPHQEREGGPHAD